LFAGELDELHALGPVIAQTTATKDGIALA
jgi:hypothetical protein